MSDLTIGTFSRLGGIRPSAAGFVPRSQFLTFRIRQMSEMSRDAFRRKVDMGIEEAKQTASKAKMDIDQRVTISLVLQRYLQAAERFEAASLEFHDSCQLVRNTLPRESRLIANINHQHYLVTCDKDGSFEVEQIDTV
jgi:hypothetical protein